MKLTDAFQTVLGNSTYMYIAVILGGISGMIRLMSHYLEPATPSDPYQPYPSDSISFLVFYMLTIIVVALVGMVINAYVIRFTADMHRNRQEDIFSVVLRKLPGIIALGIILTFIYFGIMILAMAPALINPVCACFSVMAALIVLFIAAVRLSFAIVALIVDDTGVTDSLYRSWDLTSGKTIDVFVFLIIAIFPAAIFAILSALIPEKYFYIAIGVGFITAYMSMVYTVMLTKGYMELVREERARTAYAFADTTPSTGPKPIFVFGMPAEEVNMLRAAGLHAIPVSFRAETSRVGDLVSYADFYTGDSTWYPKRVAIMYGMGPPEMEWAMQSISSILRSDIIFGTINIHNVDMSVGELLNALSREHESRKV